MEHIRVFLWQVKSGSLLTNHACWFHHMAANPSYTTCNVGLHETIMHALRDCHILHGFWSKLVDLIQFPEFYTTNVHDWLLNNLSHKGNSDEGWSILFSSVVHFLWRVRNEELFQLGTPFIKDMLEHFWFIFQSQHHGYAIYALIASSSVDTLLHVHWEYPMEGWVKVNCDGSVLHDLKAACGRLIRGAIGDFLGGFAANFGSCPVIISKLRGAYYGLLLTWNKGWRQMVLEMDSSSAIALIHNTDLDRHPYASVLKHVQSLVQRAWVVKIQHIYLERNRAVDFLASLGHGLQLGVCFYDLPPIGLASFLKDDVAGISFLRVVLSFSLFGR